jgi:hypothetical protein
MWSCPSPSVDMCITRMASRLSRISQNSMSLRLPSSAVRIKRVLWLLLHSGHSARKLLISGSIRNRAIKRASIALNVHHSFRRIWEGSPRKRKTLDSGFSERSTELRRSRLHRHVLRMARKNCRVSIRHVAVADTPCRTISGHHRSFLPELPLIVRILSDATVPHLIVELASRPRARELSVGDTENHWSVFVYRRRRA